MKDFWFDVAKARRIAAKELLAHEYTNFVGSEEKKCFSEVGRRMAAIENFLAIAEEID